LHRGYVSNAEQIAQLQPGIASEIKGDSGLWDALSGARDGGEFCRAWLGIQCGMISGTVAGLLLLDDGDGHFSSTAVWPDNRRDLTYLADTAQQALTRRTSFVNQPVTVGTAVNNVHLGQPIEIAGRLKGVVVIDLRRPAADLPIVVRQLRWGLGWLEALFERQQIEQDSANLARTNFALKVLSETQEHASFRAATLSVANELATRLNCCRVSIGFAHGQNIRVVAISHSAVFNEKTHVISTIENAMEEAADQNASVAVPASPKTQRRIALAHEDLARRFGLSAVASVPMTNGVKCIGVILLERDRGEAFDDKTLELLEAVAALVGPSLETKSETNKLITGRAVHAAGSTLKALFGPGRPTFKIAAIGIAAILAYLAFAQGDFRIAAKAVVEGAIQRATVAPFDGYIATAPVRAGDIVEPGQVLATLDDRELKLEAARWKSEHDQQLLKYSDAMAKHDRSTALVISASLDQSQAQLALVQDKLARSVITSPFRGVVVSGDLRQMLGSPVEKGKILFEIAPLESFRVILQVDERDIAYLAEGQQGTLVLTGLSNEAAPFSVKTITPVATASEGRNHFRVEADVHGAARQLRPGMEGIGKVTIDRRPLLAIWTRSLTDWARITAWKWLP
jgi:multidrug efflux pump subunit AcrA (membrane-fusion protein)